MLCSTKDFNYEERARLRDEFAAGVPASAALLARELLKKEGARDEPMLAV